MMAGRRTGAKATLARDAGTDRLEATILAGLIDRYDHILATGRAANPPPPRLPGRRRRLDLPQRDSAGEFTSRWTW
jgi:hypothetical protein